MAVRVAPSAGFCILTTSWTVMPASRLFDTQTCLSNDDLNPLRPATMNEKNQINVKQLYLHIAERSSMEQYGIFLRNQNMCQRQPQVQKTSKNHHPLPPCLNCRASQGITRMSKELVPLAACANSKQRKSKGVSKTMVVMCSNMRGTFKYRHLPATIYLQGQDCQGKACYAQEFVPLAASAESKKNPGMKAPKQRVVLCANKW